MAFDILVICTGNICRSPAAAQILASGLEPDVTVSSAGVAAVVGSDIDPAMADAMRRAGVRPCPHRARQVNEQLLSTADLVLTMDTKQRGRLLGLAPKALSRSFTLREFALICGHLRDAGELTWPARLAEESRLGDLTERASHQRGRFPPGPGTIIEDPYRHPPSDYDRALQQISAAVEQILSAVRVGLPATDPTGLRDV